MSGKVYLVGAGPGDPELLTLKAHRLLGEADVVLHDELVSQEVLACVRPSARVENVGKRCGSKRITQEEIGDRMVGYARKGRMVVRLKGGDPLVFGRATDEMQVLHRSGVDFEMVPGVTSALGAAAAARISLTDRRFASKLIFISNHHCSEKESADFENLGFGDATIAVYMPGRDYPALAARMLTAGLSPDTPCVIVSGTTTENEAIHWTELAGLADTQPLATPAMIIIGKVATAENGVGASGSSASSNARPQKQPKVALSKNEVLF